MGRMDITHRFAQQASDAFHRLDFDATTVATILANSGPVLKVEAYNLATEIIRCIACDYDYGNFSDDEEETRVIIMSRRLMDVLDPDEEED